MGLLHSKNIIESSQGNKNASSEGLQIEDFETPDNLTRSVIGIGTFGRVSIMRKKDDSRNNFLAVKTILKSTVLRKKMLQNVINEFNILSSLGEHPFIVSMQYAFQDSRYLYVCSPLMIGGSLRRLIKSDTDIDMKQIIKYVGEITLAIQYLHSRNVVHRDIKPENLLLDSFDRIHVTDFNISKWIKPGTEQTAYHEDGWGTCGYRAPEVYMRAGHGHVFACDWFSLGCVTYELLVEKVPYKRLKGDSSHIDIVNRIKAEQVDMSGIGSEHARDFVQRLLKFKPENRLGCENGPSSEVILLTHPFFDGLDWDILEHASHQDEPPLDVRVIEANFDEELDDLERIRVLDQNMRLLGLDGMNESDSDMPKDKREELEDELAELNDSQQALFVKWYFNIETKRTLDSLPKYSLLQMLSSMDPDQFKTWIKHTSTAEIRELCIQIKEYREASLQENFEFLQSQIQNERLREENLSLVRKIVNLERELKNLRIEKEPSHSN